MLTYHIRLLIPRMYSAVPPSLLPKPLRSSQIVQLQCCAACRSLCGTHSSPCSPHPPSWTRTHLCSMPGILEQVGTRTPAGLPPPTYQHYVAPFRLVLPPTSMWPFEQVHLHRVSHRCTHTGSRIGSHTGSRTGALTQGLAQVHSHRVSRRCTHTRSRIGSRTRSRAGALTQDLAQGLCSHHRRQRNLSQMDGTLLHL